MVDRRSSSRPNGKQNADLLIEQKSKKWNEFISNHDKADIFHTHEIMDVYNLTKYFEPCVTIIERENKILGLALGEISCESVRFLGLSRRTIFYAEPIYNGELHNLDILLKDVKQLSKGLFVQIRLNNYLSKEEELIYTNNGFKREDHLSAIIELTDKDTVWNNFYKDKKKGIRKAVNNLKIEIRERSNGEGIELFYDLLAQLYKRKRHSLKSKEYFQNIIKYGKGKIRILFAYYQGEPIATQLFSLFKDRMKAIYTATLRGHLDKHAGDLLIWKLIEIGFENKIKVFDFGGGGNPNIKYGPREYKERFGAQFINTGRWIYKKSILYSIVMGGYKAILRN